MATLKDDVDKLDARTDSLLSNFDREAGVILSRAQVRTLNLLRSRLVLEPDGTVKQTAQNVQIMRTLPALFRQAMRTEGYEDLLVGFVSSFNGGLPTLDQILEKITSNYSIRPVQFTGEDIKYFDAVKQGTLINLDAVIDQTANNARRATMFSVGGTPFDELSVTLAEKLNIALSDASALAATGISTFYRTVAKIGYDQIEDSLGPSKQLEYTYYGPLDKLNRPFCLKHEKQARAGTTWTREQIDRMDNGQLPDVFTTCGGFRCRHQWLVALR